MSANDDTNSTARQRLFYTALVTLYGLIVLFPVAWLVSMTLKPKDIMFARPTEWLFTPTLENFIYVIESGFLSFLLTSIVLSTISTALVVVIGTPAAYAFSRFQLWRKDDLFLFILATRMAPPVCLVIPFYLIYSKTGLLDTYLGIVIAYLTFNLSFYIWVLSSFCRDLPVELEEAAATEGYSRVKIFWKITLPILRPGMTATAVLCFIFAWNEFMFAFLLGGQNVKSLPVAIPLLITNQGVRWGELAVVGVIALVPVLIGVFFTQKHIVRGLTMGAVKG